MTEEEWIRETRPTIDVTLRKTNQQTNNRAGQVLRPEHRADCEADRVVARRDVTMSRGSDCEGTDAGRCNCRALLCCSQKPFFTFLVLCAGLPAFALALSLLRTLAGTLSLATIIASWVSETAPKVSAGSASM